MNRSWPTARAWPGIIYAATRRETEVIAATLRGHDVNAVAYHAGLASDERRAIQDAFMAAEYDVIVATIAFGMGIDKSDVRFVLHAGISESLDAYYQEIGRAVRDSKPAVAILVHDPKDLDLRRFQTGTGELPEEAAADVLKALVGHRRRSGPARVREAVELIDSCMRRVLNRLEEVGAVEIEPDGTIEPLHQRRDIRLDAEAAVQAHGRHQ